MFTLKRILFILICISLQISGVAQNQLKDGSTVIDVDDKGIITKYSYSMNGEAKEISFRSDPYLKGPSLFFNEQSLDVEQVAQKIQNKLQFSGKTDSIAYSLTYTMQDEALAIKVELKNLLNKEIKDPTFTLKPGVNTELEKYPEWNYIFFPTLLRCEKTHFWGYLMNGVGDVVAMGTEDAVASWQMEYNLPGHWRGAGGHLIFSYRLDLMHRLPLPERHPQHLTVLKANESKTWTYYLKPVDSLEGVKPAMAKTISAPMLNSEKYTVAEGESFELDIHTKSPVKATVTDPNGKVFKAKVSGISNGQATMKYSPKSGKGVYTVQVTDKNKKLSTASFTVRQDYSWYLNRAREASVRYQQYAASHLENWLGLHSGFLAAKYEKNAELDQHIEERLNTIMKIQWDETTFVPKFMYEMRKVANTAQMISVCVDAYEATGNIEYLKKARGLATIVMTFQYENGDYQDYSAIFYPVKSMMELLLAEYELLDDPEWKLYYEKHYASINRAIDFLVKKMDNIMTEGQQTFEDGMIGCSATQISMFALLQTDPKLKKHYTEAAKIMAAKHRPLEQQLIPDSRMNGGSIRFWEAQYDVLETKKWNLINSPHGWSAWRLYGTWYLYLLTGDELYLTDLINSVGSCVQVIDTKSGTLRWAFCADPYCEVRLLRKNDNTPGTGEYYETVVGEEYIPMITDFHHPPKADTVAYGRPRTNGWSCNNDVHEIFKNMEEVVLTHAYVLEKEDGSFIEWNCIVEKNGSSLKITPSEKIVDGIHLNLKKEYHVKTKLGDKNLEQQFSGMGWIGKTPFPKEIYIPEARPPRILRD